MVILIGNNLGKRQQELNTKVNEAASNHVNFDKVKAETEKSDVDKLYKIDLASNYKNIDYIVEIFKAGDSLHISRALKCIWLYDDEFSNIINSDYLHHNVFPFMSMKMKKKLLSTVSTYVRNEERAEDFYTYCIGESNMSNIALKFLIFTSESFKIDIIKANSKSLELIQNKEGEYLKHFIGESFSLADIYLKTSTRKSEGLHELRYLYSVSEVKYLELIGTYDKKCFEYYGKRYLGFRVSRDLIKKHKSRIYENPLLYLNIINKTALAKYSTSDDSKFYAVALLPKDNFWKSNYYDNNKHILDRIPLEERLSYIKKIFTENYPGKEFEMSLDFYTYKYYDLMSLDEREVWALRHIENEAEVLGSGKDYIWYKFVNFEQAFLNLKKYITITSNGDKRLEILKILIESARNMRDVDKILNYYYERHINESKFSNKSFVDSIIQYHNVYEFDDDCWTAFNKLLYSLEVYDRQNHNNYGSNYKNIALIYYIVNKKDVPDILNQFIGMEEINFYSLKDLCSKLDEEKQEMVYKYIIQFYENKITSFMNESNDVAKNKVRPYIQSTLNVMRMFYKTKDDIPNIIESYIKLDWDEFKYNSLFSEYIEPLTQNDLIRCLKKDATFVIDKLPVLKESVKNESLKLNQLLKKIKIYFSDSIAKQYLAFFIELLAAPELNHYVAEAAVYGIFQLADDNFKIDFMANHVPKNPKIDHVNTCRNELLIQQAICSSACYSRPPVPLTNLLMYIKGDYVHFCLSMFDVFLVNLPLPCCMEFVESILDRPVSVQKHGLRLAFQCFRVETLRKLILDIWKKTKNVTLRMIIYKALLEKIIEERGNEQKDLFEVLKILTLDLHQDDDEDLFYLLKRNGLSNELRGEHLACAWKAVSQLPGKSLNIERMTNIINCIEQEICSFPRDVLQALVEEHVNNMFITKPILTNFKSDYDVLIRAKWELTAKSIVYVTGKEQLEKNLEIVKFIMKKCLEMWCEVNEGTYVMKRFCFQFICDLQSKSSFYFSECYPYVDIIFKTILSHIEGALPEHEIYILIWDLRLFILARNVAICGKEKLSEDDTHDKKVLLLKDSIVNFAKELVCLINEFIKKEQFYTSLFPEIIAKVTEKVQSITYYINYFDLNNFTFVDMHVLISSTLIEIETSQIYIFAIMLLPSIYCGNFSEVYRNVLEKIKAFENGEVQCKLHQKIFNDFTYRKF